MTYKIAISKPGYDVLTTTDPRYLIFSSEYNTLKYYTNGTTTLTIDYSTYYATDTDPFGSTLYLHTGEVWINHNLGYKPFFLVYVRPSSVSYYNLCPYEQIGAFDYEYLQAYTDSTRIYVRLDDKNYNNSGTFTYYISYKIFINNIGI